MVVKDCIEEAITSLCIAYALWLVIDKIYAMQGSEK